MDNMSIYNSLCTPPNDALKPIGFGSLKGFSDINPQWRYEAITNQFGPCGIGWKFTIDSHWIQPVSTGETMVYVMINFYYKDGDKWSEPIPAYGGDYLVKKDKNGIHGNDEAMKMAVTDALGTAMKMIGVAADVYRGLIANGASDSKYARRDYMAQTAQNRPQQPAKQNAGTYKGNTANNTTDEMRAKAIKSLNAEIERTGVASTEVAAIAKAKYGKASVKEMSTGQICDLANNLEKFLMEQIEQAST
jgi:hypothetical protein